MSNKEALEECMIVIRVKQTVKDPGITLAFTLIWDPDYVCGKLIISSSLNLKNASRTAKLSRGNLSLRK